MLVLFFKQKTAYEMRISDWSSDVCSSDLPTKASRFANCLPNQLPAPASAAIQIVEPAAVQIRNLSWFICTMPAGSDTIVRATGMKRAMKTIAGPYLRKKSCIFSTSSQLSVSQRSEEHTSELQSLMRISYAVFCLKNK